MTDVTETLSTVELLWIIIALVATFFSARGLIKWRREDRQRKVDGLNGPLAVFYRGKIRLFSLGLVAFLLCLLLGLQSALVPPRPEMLHAGFQTILGRALIYTAPLVVVVVIALFAAALILDERDRALTDRAHDKKAEQRLLAIETAARHAAMRADVAERRADTAAVAMEGLTPRVDSAEGEQRLLSIEATARHAAMRADSAETRADVAERRADDAAITVEGLTPRVDDAEGEITVHDEEITDHDKRLDGLEGKGMAMRDEMRQQCYAEIEAMAKAALDRYYMEYPERLADERSDDAIAWSLRGIHRVFKILDRYDITRPTTKEDKDATGL